MPLPPFCLEDVTGRRQAALSNQPWWEDKLTDGVLLMELGFKGSLTAFRVHMSGVVPVPSLSAGLSLPPRVLASPLLLLPALQAALVSVSGPVV